MRWLAVCLGTSFSFALMIVAASAQTDNARSSTNVSVLPVQGSVSMITAGGINIAAQVGKTGVVLVDSPDDSLVPAVQAELRKLTERPAIRYIVNTSVDRVGGNAALVGPVSARGTGGAPFGFVGLNRPTIIAQDNVLVRLTATTPAPPPATLPTMTYFMPAMDFYANDEPIVVYHQPNAVTDGDSVLLFRKSDVIVAGDILTPGRYPLIDTLRGGTVDGLVKALGTLLTLAIPEAFEQGGTRIIPGRGRIVEETDVAEFRDMVVIIKDRIRDAMSKGRTLNEIKASRPSMDFDVEYNATPADADRFVEAIYRSLPPLPQEPPVGRNRRSTGGR